MSFVLRGFVASLCIVLLICVVHLIGKDQLQLKYSLLWLMLVALLLLGAIYPNGVFYFSGMLGFETASNFAFFIGLFSLLTICLSLSVIVSKQTVRIKNLLQRLALVEHELERHKHLKND